jgi:hypothetical protein
MFFFLFCFFLFFFVFLKGKTLAKAAALRINLNIDQHNPFRKNLQYRISFQISSRLNSWPHHLGRTRQTLTGVGSQYLRRSRPKLPFKSTNTGILS